jgi:hypothetical protein
MSADQLYTSITARPFRAFRIRMANGRSIDVFHPECITYVPSAPGARIAQRDGTDLVVEVALIVSLEFMGDVQ